LKKKKKKKKRKKKRSVCKNKNRKETHVSADTFVLENKLYIETKTNKKKKKFYKKNILCV